MKLVPVKSVEFVSFGFDNLASAHVVLKFISVIWFQGSC